METWKEEMKKGYKKMMDKAKERRDIGHGVVKNQMYYYFYFYYLFLLA